MKIPLIKYNDKFLNLISWIGIVEGITIFPFIILREKFRDIPYYQSVAVPIINHESIHIKQQAELLVIFFYILYLLEWFVKVFKYGKYAYENISFEREIHTNSDNPNYIKTRKFWAWLDYL